jgi:hypothetical protein
VSGTVLGGSMIGIRGWELVCLGLWLIGLVLVVRYGRTRFLAGIYTGATLSALLWDWILGAGWFFRITFDDRFVMLYTIQGRPEPLWAPLSYGFFFGITSLVALRYRRRLDATLGNWQFVVVPVLLGLSDFVIEGITVGALELYVFRYDPAWLLFGVPYTNVLMIAVTECCILYAARGMGELLERAGVPAVSVGGPVVAAAGGGPAAGAVSLAPAVVDTPGGLARPWTPFVIGLVIPSGAVYLGALVTTAVLNPVQPW